MGYKSSYQTNENNYWSRSANGEEIYGAFGNYQFVSLVNIIDYFMFVYVGEDKIIPKARRTDVAFHAQRAMQELSFDTFKSCKSEEITVPASLQMVLPRDYINYTKLSWVDSAGIKHPLYPTSKTSNPSKYQAHDNGEYLFAQGVGGGLIPAGEMLRNGNFHGYIFRDWALNKVIWSHGGHSDNIREVGTSDYEVEPQKGWFHMQGYNQTSSLQCFNCPGSYGILQRNLPIIAGQQYKITYTIRNFTSGELAFRITDSEGDSKKLTHTLTDGGTHPFGNGTFTQTVTMDGSPGDYIPGAINIYNVGGAAGVLDIILDDVSMVRVGDEETSTTWSNYKSTTPSENNNDDYEDDTYWPLSGGRYGLDPQHAQVNGSFYIDCKSGKIHFSSNISGKTVILDYISDSLGSEIEMQVHKFAEQAMYAWIAHAILAGKSNIPEYQVNRFKKERFAAIRTAKLRLSNIKLEEITQILRGKSKQIKH